MFAERRENILKLIGERPNIRTVEIADRLDLDVEQVETSLQPEIGSGNVLAAPIIAPNGREVSAYRLKDAPAPVAAPAPAAQTKTDIAIAYLRDYGPVDTTFLHRAMGLKKSDSPSQYIATAIAKGRIVREGRMWNLSADERAKAGPAQAVDVPAPVVKPKAEVKPSPAVLKAFDALDVLKVAPAIAAADMPDIDVPVTRKPEALAQLASKNPAEPAPFVAVPVPESLKAEFDKIPKPAAEPAAPAYAADDDSDGAIMSRFGHIITAPAAVSALPVTTEYDVTARFHAEQTAAAVPAPYVPVPVPEALKSEFDAIKAVHSAAPEAPQEAAAPAPAANPELEPINVPAPAPAAVAAAAQVKPYRPKFSAGLFSDGRLVIEHGYEKLTLPPESARALCRYLLDSRPAPSRAR